MICITSNIGSETNYKYVVILSFYNGQLLFSRHKNRTTWETQGGHIEVNETPLDAAKRELYEESGALEYDISEFCDYWAGTEDKSSGATGVVYIANIKRLGKLPESEMAEIKTFSSLPDNLTYPSITTTIYNKYITQ